MDREISVNPQYVQKVSNIKNITTEQMCTKLFFQILKSF